MSANDFEKKVQFKMEELNLPPSEEVWVKVEKRIRQDKKKRRFFFWIFFLGLLLAGGIIITKWKGSEKNVISGTQKNISVNPKKKLPASEETSAPVSKPVELNIPGSTTNNNDNNIAAREGITKKEISGKKFSQNDQDKKIIPKDDMTGKNKISEPIQKKEKELNKEIVEKFTDMNPVKTPEIKNIEEAKSIIEKPSDSIQQMGNAEKVENKIKNKIDPDVSFIDSTNSDKKEMQKEFVEVKVDSSANLSPDSNPSIQKKIPGKWKLALMLQSGISGIAEGISFFNNNSYADSYAYASSSSASGGIPSYNFASPIKPSGSFAAGFSLNRSVSKKLDINFGLVYSYLSNKRNVGNRVDSLFSLNSTQSANNYYRSSVTGNQSFRNQYHFLKISTELSWKFINLKKIPVYWNNALSYDRLISSNALRYNGNIPGYYKDFSALTHNHFFLTTGLSVPLLKRFELNPYAAWSMTKVWRYAGATPTHFTDYGLRIKILLGKK